MSKKVIISAITLIIAGGFALSLIKQEPAMAPIPSPGPVDQQALMHEQFPDIPENNRFAIETADQVIDRLESGTGIVFLGFKECPWCQKMAPILNQAAEDGGATIYYIDIKKLREDHPTNYQRLLVPLVPHLPKDSSGKTTISTPDITFVKDGEIIWRYEMDLVTEAGRTPDAYWTDARKEQALKQFADQIKELREEE